MLRQQFGNLHSVRRRPFSEIIAHTPEGEAVGVRQVFADPADVHQIRAVGRARERILR